MKKLNPIRSGKNFKFDPRWPIFRSEAQVRDELFIDFFEFFFLLFLLIDTENVHSTTTNESSTRVPPIKIKLVQPEKTIPSCPPLDSTFYCLLELEKIDLSLFDVSNLPVELPTIEKQSPSINVPVPKTALKQNLDKRKSLKRLNSTEKRKNSSTHRNSKKRNSNSLSSDISMLSSIRSSITSEARTSISSKKINEVIRPDLPDEYRCSVLLTRIDLSSYDVDISSTLTPLSQSQTTKNRSEIDVRTNENRQESILNDDVLSLEPMTTDDSLLPIIDDVLTEVMRETASALAEQNDLPTISIDELLSSVDNETDVSLIVNQSESHCEIESNTSRDISISPGLPTLEDDPVLNSTNESPSMINTDDCMIIVQCSDDEDYGEDEELMKRNRMNSLEDETETKSFSNATRDTSEKFNSDSIQMDESKSRNENVFSFSFVVLFRGKSSQTTFTSSFFNLFILFIGICKSSKFFSFQKENVSFLR